jgi:cardiolipin synthase
MRVVWNVPNVLTLLRVSAAPLLAYFLLSSHYTSALYTFAAAALTDMLDGFVARHFNRTTEFGAALDPLADKLITLTCLLILTFQTLVPLWLALVMVVRDAVIVAGAFAYHHLFGEIDIHPTWFGKLYTVAAFALFIAVLANAAQLIAITNYLPIFFLLVLVLAVGSLAQYVWLWGKKARSEAARRAA